MASVALRIGNYVLGDTLGSGTFGKVKVAEHRITGHKVAVKILNRKRINDLEVGAKIKREIQILKLFRHPHIIKLYEVIDTPTDIFMVMEYVSGGELFHYLVKHGRINEDTARRFFQQIVSGVLYCHQHMVAHRDLKPENLLLDENFNVKIADFGLSNIMRDGEFLSTSCGSPNYAAPEVISGKLYAGPEVDVWSCGVILYALLCGRLPFDDDEIPDLFRKIKGGVFTMPAFLSEGAQDLLLSTLVVDPLRRFTLDQVRKHPWFMVALPPYMEFPEDPPETDTTVDERVLSEVCARLNASATERQAARKAVMEGTTSELAVAYRLSLDSAPEASDAFDAKERDQPLTVHIGSPPAWDFKEDLDTLTPNPQKSMRISDDIQRRTRLGLTTRDPPPAVMSSVYAALRRHDMEWKCVTAYHLRCRPVCASPPADLPPVSPGRRSTRAATASVFIPGTPPEKKRRASVSTLRPRDTETPGPLKFTVQLYRVDSDLFVLDFKCLSGPTFQFLELCGKLMALVPT